jgi:hypothetical protein
VTDELRVRIRKNDHPNGGAARSRPGVTAHGGPSRAFAVLTALEATSSRSSLLPSRFSSRINATRVPHLFAKNHELRRWLPGAQAGMPVLLKTTSARGSQASRRVIMATAAQAETYATERQSRQHRVRARPATVGLRRACPYYKKPTGACY